MAARSAKPVQEPVIDTPKMVVTTSGDGSMEVVLSRKVSIQPKQYEGFDSFCSIKITVPTGEDFDAVGLQLQEKLDQVMGPELSWYRDVATSCGNLGSAIHKIATLPG